VNRAAQILDSKFAAVSMSVLAAVLAVVVFGCVGICLSLLYFSSKQS